MNEDAFNIFIFVSRGSVNFLGIIGNLISFIVFCRPVFRKNSISVYCCALAVFDCFVLNQLIMDIYLLFFDYFPPNYSEITCKIYYYISTAFSNIPAWILVSFSIDKMLSMKTSKRFEFIKKRSFQIGIITVFAIVNVLLFSEILVLLKRVPLYPNNSIDLICDLNKMPLVSIFGALYLLIGSIIPFIIMSFSSVSIFKLLKESRKKTIGNGNNPLAYNRKNRDFKFAISSLTFNCLFITLKMPIAIYYILSSLGVNFSLSFFNIASLLYFINSSINFFVHIVSNSLFRKELCIILRITVSIPSDQVQSCRILTVRPLNTTD